MGICFVAYAVNDATVARVLADPPLIWRVLEPDDENVYLRASREDTRPSLLSTLLGRSAPPLTSHTLEFSAPELRVLDLDKSWGGPNACLRVCAPEIPSFFELTAQRDARPGCKLHAC